MAFRIKRNCSQPDQCELRFSELANKLQERGYRKRSVEEAIEKVRVQDRERMLVRVEGRSKNENRVRAVFRYDRKLPNISAILNKSWKTMI